MPDYYHSALKGDQLHEAKIKALPPGSPFPVPEWEGQCLAIGSNFYYALRQNNTLIWNQPTASNQPQLPGGTVKFQRGGDDPPPFQAGSGIIYQNASVQKLWYLSNSTWLELGVVRAESSFEIIADRPAAAWLANYFGLLSPENAFQENCLRITKWLPNKKYYFAIKTPSISVLNLAMDNNIFYLEIWRDYTQNLISTHVENSKTLTFIDTNSFESGFPDFSFTEFRLAMYCLRNQQKQYLNFFFDFESRFLEPAALAQLSYGY